MSGRRAPPRGLLAARGTPVAAQWGTRARGRGAISDPPHGDVAAWLGTFPRTESEGHRGREEPGAPPAFSVSKWHSGTAGVAFPASVAAWRVGHCVQDPGACSAP